MEVVFSGNLFIFKHGVTWKCKALRNLTPHDIVRSDHKTTLFIISQLRIAEWYSIKNNCYDTFKEVALTIEKNKQYMNMLPSRHITREKEEELKLGVSPLASAKGLEDLKKRVQNRNSYGQDVTALLEEEDEKEIDAEIVMNVVDHMVAKEETKEDGKLLSPNVAKKRRTR